MDEWAAGTAGGPLSSPQWDVGQQFQLEVKEHNIRGCLVLELVDKDMDARDTAGQQADDSNWPAVQITVCEGKGKNIKLTRDDTPKVLLQAASKQPYPDGVILEIPLNAYVCSGRGRRPPQAAHHACAPRARRLPKTDAPYIILPTTTEPGVLHKFAISAYTNRPAELSRVTAEPCGICPGNCKECPMVHILRKMDALDTRFANHLSFLERIPAA